MLSFYALSANAGTKTRTKSNNSNDRQIAQGIISTDNSESANSCTTGAENWSWSVSSVSNLSGGSGGASASYARNSNNIDSFTKQCDMLQSAMAKVSLSDISLAKFADAVDADDGEAIIQILSQNGIPNSVLIGASAHAINTKGTGGTNPHAKTSNISDLNVTKGDNLNMTVSYNKLNKTGHITLNR